MLINIHLLKWEEKVLTNFFNHLSYCFGNGGEKNGAEVKLWSTDYCEVFFYVVQCNVNKDFPKWPQLTINMQGQMQKVLKKVHALNANTLGTNWNLMIGGLSVQVNENQTQVNCPERLWKIVL